MRPIIIVDFFIVNYREEFYERQTLFKMAHPLYEESYKEWVFILSWD